jgi:MFS family permease
VSTGPSRGALASSGGPSRARILTAVVGVMVLTCVPMFLAGSLSSLLGAELGLDASTMGALLSAYFVAAALGALPAGRLADRLGATIALRIAAVGGMVVLLSVGLVVGSLWPFVALFVLGGASLALADTGSARALATAVPPSWQGSAFGVKEASVPAAALLAGLAVPLLGARYGWRPAFTGAGALGLLALAVVPSGLRADARGSRSPAPVARVDAALPAGAAPSAAAREPVARTDRPSSHAASPDHGRPGVPLPVLAIAAGLAGAVAAAASTFLVPSLEASGVALGTAGFVLSVASSAAVVTRLVVGRLADRRPGSELAAIRVLIGTGALGLALLALASTPQRGSTAAGTVLLVAAAFVTLGAGWGWTGVVFLAAVRTDPTRPAVAAAAVLAGLGLGGAAGPAVVGRVADLASFRAAWLGGALAMVVAVLALWLARGRGPMVAPTSD